MYNLVALGLETDKQSSSLCKVFEIQYRLKDCLASKLWRSVA